MANFDTISAAMLTQFKTDVYMLARQQQSIYLPLVDIQMVGGKPGERVVFQRIGEATVNEVTDRYQELEANNLPNSARSLTLRHFHTHVTLDTLDDMRMVFDPSGPYVDAMSKALAKKMDEIIRSALVGSADNRDGSSSTSATAGINLSTSIELAELITARAAFNDAWVRPGEDVFFMVEANGYTDIMGIDQVIRADYNVNKPLVAGQIGRFLDFAFIYDPLMPKYTDGTSNQAIAFTRKGIRVALPQDIKISIDRIPERRNAMLMQAEFVMGAVRMEENQVRWMYHT